MQKGRGTHKKSAHLAAAPVGKAAASGSSSPHTFMEGTLPLEGQGTVGPDQEEPQTSQVVPLSACGGRVVPALGEKAMWKKE